MMGTLIHFIIRKVNMIIISGQADLIAINERN
jgi:hypothetical protein